MHKYTFVWALEAQQHGTHVFGSGGSETRKKKLFGPGGPAGTGRAFARTVGAARLRDPSGKQPGCRISQYWADLRGRRRQHRGAAAPPGEPGLALTPTPSQLAQLMQLTQLTQELT